MTDDDERPARYRPTRYVPSSRRRPARRVDGPLEIVGWIALIVLLGIILANQFHLP